MNLKKLIEQWIGEEDTTISLNELEKTYVNAGIRFKIKDLKSKIPDLIEQIEEEILEKIKETQKTIRLEQFTVDTIINLIKQND